MPETALVFYPDARLATVAAPVDDFGPDLAALADRFGRALADIPAIGLAGPHLGVAQRVVATALSGRGSVRFYVNPEIVWRSEETERHEEGSVSMPGIVAEVERPRTVRVRYADVDGMVREEEASGFAAAVLQHEIDQLDGVFWIARLSPLKRERLIRRWRKLNR